MTEENFELKETKCNECGKNEFRLKRMTEHQVLAECIHCGHPHTIDSIRENKTGSSLLYWFTIPKEIGRCVECRYPLRIHDISVQTGRARLECKQCGLLHFYQKSRLRGWRMVRVTRRARTSLRNEEPS